jgi:putative colanic acid biosynthesis acetyltransferase WcaF
VSERNLAGFTGVGYDKGRGIFWQATWVAASSLAVERTWCPPKLRVVILRAFGAKIGKNVNIRQHVRIHWPWKLRIANDVWIGVDAWLLNLEPITIGSNVCISQGVFLCTGSHDRRSPTFEFDNAPIVIGDGSWIAARATVLRGVTVGPNALVGATALLTHSLASGASAFAPSAVIAP